MKYFLLVLIMMTMISCNNDNQIGYIDLKDANIVRTSVNHGTLYTRLRNFQVQYRLAGSEASEGIIKVENSTLRVDNLPNCITELCESGNLRRELSIKEWNDLNPIRSNDSFKYGFSFKMTDNIQYGQVIDVAWTIITQIHETSFIDANYSPPFSLQLNGNRKNEKTLSVRHVIDGITDRRGAIINSIQVYTNDWNKIDIESTVGINGTVRVFLNDLLFAELDKVGFTEKAYFDVRVGLYQRKDVGRTEILFKNIYMFK